MTAWIETPEEAERLLDSTKAARQSLRDRDPNKCSPKVPGLRYHDADSRLLRLDDSLQGFLDAAAGKAPQVAATNYQVGYCSQGRLAVFREALEAFVAAEKFPTGVRLLKSVVSEDMPLCVLINVGRSSVNARLTHGDDTGPIATRWPSLNAVLQDFAALDNLLASLCRFAYASGESQHQQKVREAIEAITNCKLTSRTAFDT